MDTQAAENAINYDTLSKTERDFLDILPEKFRLSAFAAYKDYRKISAFGSVFERSKMCSAYMTGIVTAVYMVQREEGGNDNCVTPEIPGN